MAVAAVEGRELRKTISWFDGVVVAPATPGLITGRGSEMSSQRPIHNREDSDGDR